MTKSIHAQLFQVLLGDLAQNGEIDAISFEDVGVLTYVVTFKPASNTAHGRSSAHGGIGVVIGWSHSAVPMNVPRFPLLNPRFLI